jgi:D-aminoacyl-tRNA deacylase
MRAVIQRVSQASVDIAGERVGEIKQGLMVLLGIQEGDDDADLDYIVKKILAMRIFPDGDGKMNKSVQEINGEILLISQFTLIADTSKGNRPSFFKAARPEQAIPLYESAIGLFRLSGISIASGRFGADMQVGLINDGPVTIILDSKVER